MLYVNIFSNIYSITKQVEIKTKLKLHFSLQLKRSGPAPLDSGHIPPRPKQDYHDHGYPWYTPDEIEYVRDDEMSETMLLNGLCSSLEYLLLNVDVFYPKHTIVPFMLHALPKIKSFGNITLVHALRMIRAIPQLSAIRYHSYIT